MTARKKSDGEMTVKKADAISDGAGGFHKVGAKFVPVDAEAAKQLRDKGLAE